MTIDLTPEQEQLIGALIAGGAYRTPGEVIGAALESLHEDVEDAVVSDQRSTEARFTLDEVEADLRALGKLR